MLRNDNFKKGFTKSNYSMNIKCIRKGKTSGLTDNKTYNVLKETEIYYFIINDNNTYQNYKKNRFLVINA